MSNVDPIEMNVNGVRDLIASKINKSGTGTTAGGEGVSDDFENELTLKLDDTELLQLAKQWELKYAGYEASIKVRQQANKAYYLGKQKEGTAQAYLEGQAISSNLLFEAEETFLPAALSKNPEPVVYGSNDPEGNKLADDVKTMLQYHADTLALRRKLTLMVRHWSIYFVGILKHGWDEEIGDIKTEVRDPRNFILDPDCYVDCYGDFEGYVGERIKVTAKKLAEMFPKHKDYISLIVEDKMGTEVTYTEWWTDEYCFYTFKDKVLDKNKNPNFNYDKETEEEDEYGVKRPVLNEGKNHFGRPKKPYTFLSVFSLQEQPHDITNLIEQNIPNQNRITRRTEQIDYNLSRANNSDVFSADNFNQETAKQAAQAMAKGHPIIVPSGQPLDGAIKRLSGQGIGDAYFKSLETDKADLRSIFGTQGITATQQDDDQTARGMILNNQYDNSRIGGGIGDALEQVAKNTFNWWVQLYYVYYDEQHFGMVLGRMKATEFVTLSATTMSGHLVVSVAPNSMKPHDEITEMNQAMSLWQAGALDPKTLLIRLNFPDPQETAAQVVLWKTNPQLYMQMNFPDLAQQMQAAMPPQVGPDGQPMAGGAGGPPEAMSEPPPDLGGVPSNADLSNVPLPK